MGVFSESIRALKQKAKSPRRWLFVPYDQLTDEIGPLSREMPQDIGIILVENTWKAQRRPYHKQKLALIVSNIRHFAIEQAKRGVAVRHFATDGPYRTAIDKAARELGPIDVMTPAERELREDLKPLVAQGLLRLLPHEGWLSSRSQFMSSSTKGPPWRMDAFYRFMRKDTGMLMESGRPVGGRFSLDTENRKVWKGSPAAPTPPSFKTDPIKEEAVSLVERVFCRNPGKVNASILPCTREDAAKLWNWAKENCLASFGPFEDAISSVSRGIFHTRISTLMNIHRVVPKNVIDDVLDLHIPIESKEGFVRQVLGWREFMAHVHRETDGFRSLPNLTPEVLVKPGDGGFAAWSGRSWERANDGAEPDGGSSPNYLEARAAIPPLYWGLPSGLRCVDEIVNAVWEEGYSHHITRLMVLGNLATLLDVTPREITDWFWIAYTDAYDWVVESNVLGMVSYAMGDLFTTKPYVSGASYINRMSDFCPLCNFDPKTNCPFGWLYWAFLARKKEKLKTNPRMRIAMASLKRRPADLKVKDSRVFKKVQEMLLKGERVTPTALENL